MVKMTCLRTGGLAAALLLCAGCGGGDPSVLQNPGVGVSGPLDPAHSGALTVRLVADGLPGPLTSLKLVLAALEVRVGGVWRPVPLAVPGRAVDILGATTGAPLVLASAVPWPEGSNDAMRFTLGAGGSLQLAGDAFLYNLTAPGTLVAGMGLPGSFYVTAQEETELWITFPVAHVAAPDPQDGEAYHFVPGLVRGYDKAATGSLSGAVAASALPLAGVAVTAQLRRVAGEGDAIAFRTALTDAQGHYSLDLLPKGYTWCVVSQPVLAAAAYSPQCSSGFALGGAPFDAYQTSLACAPVPVPGTVSGSVAGASNPASRAEVELVQEIPDGGAANRYVLRSAPVVEDAHGLRSFRMPLVPPGVYSVVLNDYSLDAGLRLVDRRRSTALFALSAGGEVILTF